jgi:streptogramin lyase
MRSTTRIAAVLCLVGVVLVPGAEVQAVVCPGAPPEYRIGPQHLVSTSATDVVVTYSHTDQIGRVQYLPATNKLFGHAVVTVSSDPDPDNPHRILLRSDLTGPGVWYSLTQVNQVGRLDADFVGAEIAETFEPLPPVGPMCNPIGIEVGPNNRLWLAEIDGNTLTRFFPDNGNWARYAVPQSWAEGDCGPQELTTAADDTWVWFSCRRGDAVGRIRASDGQFGGPFFEDQVFGPHAMITGADDKVWMTEFLGNAVSRINPTGSPALDRCDLQGTGIRRVADIIEAPGGVPGDFFVYFSYFKQNAALQTVKSWIGGLRVKSTWTWTEICASKRLFPLTDGATPKGIAVGPDGNSIWVTEPDLNGVAFLDLATSAVTECRLPLATGGEGVCGGPITQSGAGGGPLVGAGDVLAPALDVAPGAEDCQAITHTLSGTLSGSIADPDTDEPVGLTGAMAITGAAPCEDADQAQGSVASVDISDPNLSFSYDGTGSFLRAGPALSAAVQGLCTFRTLEYHCEITLAGTWDPVVDVDSPEEIGDADLVGATVAIKAI